MARTWTRWLPAAAVPLVVAGSLAVATTSAGADELPERSPEDVLTLLAGHEHQPLSGEFTQTSDLGLPSLPADLPGTDGDTAAVLDGLELITSDHTGRVFLGEEDQARLQLFDTFGEQNAIVNGSEAWLYDSADNSATHITAPEGTHPDGAAPQLTPEVLAERVVAAADPSTELSVRENVEVAGRTAYDLVLTPRTEDTLVGEVSIAVDGETGLPLRVSITARGADGPAIEVGYTELDLSAPDPDLFDFTPPADATVEEVEPQRHDAGEHHGTDSGQPRPQTTGTGWETVLAAPAGTADLSQVPVLTQLTSAVDGGQALSTDLLTVLITDDGRVLAGAVPLERLQAVA